jgi:hypothetical protein
MSVVLTDPVLRRARVNDARRNEEHVAGPESLRCAAVNLELERAVEHVAELLARMHVPA